mgnify:CR=1 FL=1
MLCIVEKTSKVRVCSNTVPERPFHENVCHTYETTILSFKVKVRVFTRSNNQRLQKCSASKVKLHIVLNLIATAFTLHYKVK